MREGASGIERATVLILPVHGTFIGSAIHDFLHPGVGLSLVKQVEIAYGRVG